MQIEWAVYLFEKKKKSLLFIPQWGNLECESLQCTRLPWEVPLSMWVLWGLNAAPPVCKADAIEGEKKCTAHYRSNISVNCSLDNQVKAKNESSEKTKWGFDWFIPGNRKVSVLLIWDSLGKASITGDVLQISLTCCKAVAYTRSVGRFMFPLKQNEQCRTYLGCGGNEPFHHIDFLKHLEKKLCQLPRFGSDCDRSAHIPGPELQVDSNGMVFPAMCCLSNR